jgi:hypothetical protein
MARVVVLLLAAALAGCGGAGGADETSSAPPTEVEGRIVEVREEAGQVRSFVVESDEGPVDLAIDPAVDYGFDLAHLHEHEETGDPVRCPVEERDGILYALEIHDA